MKLQRTKKQELVRVNRNNYQQQNDYDFLSNSNASYSDELVKVIDKNGVSIQPIGAEYRKNKYLKKDIRLSKHGYKPYVCYPETDFNSQPTKIAVVKKYAKYENIMHKSKKALMNEANRVSNEAAKKYQDDVMKAKLTTEKNLLAARINSLRLTNKAMIIEKDYNETYAETMRHKQVIKDIERLKNLLLENNDINLNERITEINLNRELELDNAKSNKEKISERILEQVEINKVKNEFIKERIKILASGQTPNKMNKELKEEIQRVKQQRAFREKGDEEIEILYSTLKRMNIDKITNKNDRELAYKLIEKFEADKKIRKLNDERMRENEMKNENTSKVNNIRSRIFKIINKKYSAQIDDQLQKKLVLDAKKSSIVVSTSIEKLMATNNRTLHTLFEDYPSTKTVTKKKSSKSKKSKAKKATNKKVSANKNSTALVVAKKKKAKKTKTNNRYNNDYVHYFDEGYTSFNLDKEFFNRKEVKDAIRKWKKIENNVESASDFSVAGYDKDSYQISYVDAKKYQKAKKDHERVQREHFLNFLLSKSRGPKADNKQKGERHHKQRVSTHNDRVKYYSEFKLAALRRRLEKLPNDPAIFNSRNSYEYRHLTEIIANFSQLSLKKLPKNPENDNFIIEVKQIIDYYDALVKDDKLARANVEKSLSLDSKLRNSLAKQEAKVVNSQTRNDIKYQKIVNSIEQEHKVAIDQANKIHAKKKQQIINDIDWQFENENDLHEKNKAFIKKSTDDLVKRSHIYENNQIDKMVKEINKFNAKQIDERNMISLSNMPTKIECFEPLVDGKIELVQQDDGVYAVNKVYSRFANTTYTAKTYNKTIPENVTKVVVLDKFRNVNNPLVRASALKELAKVEYEDAVEYNLAREKQEINRARNVLQKHKEYSDSLVDDAYEFNEYLELTRSKSNYSTFVQKEHLKRSKTKWKLTEANLRRQHAIECDELKWLEHKNKKLELAQKRIENRRNKYLSSMDNDALFETIRITSEKKSPVSKRENSIVPYYGYEKNKQQKKNNSFISRITSLFRTKKEDDIDEIVGRK